MLELQVVLWSCGGSTEEAQHCQECRRAGKQCPASPWAGGTGVGSNQCSALLGQKLRRSWGSCAVASLCIFEVVGKRQATFTDRVLLGSARWSGGG